MDQWSDEIWLNRAGRPVLHAVSGHAVRVLPRPNDHLASGPDLPGHPSLAGEGLAEDEAPQGIRVLVVGDDVLARRGVLAALDGEPGMVVVGEHRYGPAVLTTLAQRHPDVVLLHGLCAEDTTPAREAVREAVHGNRHRGGRDVRVLGIGVRDGEASPDADGLMCGSLPAWATPEEVVAAVRIAAAGFVLSRTDRSGQLLRLDDTGRGRHVTLDDGLSERECDVLALVATGMSNAEIADELSVSEHTVKAHVRNLLGKLGLRNRIHAVIYAFESGLVPAYRTTKP